MRKGIVAPVVALLVVLLLAAIGYAWYAKRQAAEAERQLGLDSTRVVQTYFQQARALKVLTLGGAIVAKSNDPGFAGLLPSSQTTKLPFTVDYFIDLTKLRPRDYRWDAARRTLVVKLPDVSVGMPNVDETTAQTTQDGVFISRDAGLRLAQSTSRAVVARASEVAKRPENIERARRQARDAMTTMTRAPLEAAGVTRVTVSVGFPWDTERSDESWDRTRSIGEVLRDTRR